MEAYGEFRVEINNDAV